MTVVISLLAAAAIVAVIGTYHWLEWLELDRDDWRDELRRLPTAEDLAPTAAALLTPDDPDLGIAGAAGAGRTPDGSHDDLGVDPWERLAEVNALYAATEWDAVILGGPEEEEQ